MRLILLGGNNSENRKWIEELERKLKEHFKKIYVHYYKHWTSNNQFIDIDYEIDKIYKYIGRKKDYIIVAKSVGSILAIRGVIEGKLKPKKCIFLGLPVYWARENKIPLDIWIKNYSDTQTLFVQNNKDPTINASNLKRYLKQIGKLDYKFIQLEGNDHTYTNFEKIKEIIISFI